MIFRISPLALLLLASCGQQEAADIQLSNAWARPTVGQAPGAVYLTIENKGGEADRLTGAFTDHAAMAMVHQNEMVDGIAKMRMITMEQNFPESLPECLRRKIPFNPAPVADRNGARLF